MSLRHLFALTVVLAATGACEIVPIAEPADAQEKPEATEAAPLTAETAAEVESGSTICRAFRAQLLELQTQLAERPGDAELRSAGAALEGIITHTCD
jgi:hypothetical protein